MKYKQIHILLRILYDRLKLEAFNCFLKQFIWNKNNSSACRESQVYSMNLG